MDTYYEYNLSPSVFIPENIPYYVDYKVDGCPDTLAYSYELGLCFVECVYPVFTDTQETIAYITGYSFGIISFLLSYFYCMTSLVRPIMMRYPNSHMFHMMFCSMIFSSSVFFSLFLGQKYVFCDTNTEPGFKNWACLVSCKFMGFYFI